jgi:hypothetical protein
MHLEAYIEGLRRDLARLQGTQPYLFHNGVPKAGTKAMVLLDLMEAAIRSRDRGAAQGEGRAA